MKKSHQTGFTLIELMITVAIIGIIIAVALPSYQTYVQRTKRGLAAVCLQELSQFMERRYATSLTYSGAALPTVACTTDLAQSYVFEFATAQPTASTFVIQATPAGGQIGDTKCATISLSHSGVKTVSGTDTVANCWR